MTSDSASTGNRGDTLLSSVRVESRVLGRSRLLVDMINMNMLVFSGAEAEVLMVHVQIIVGLVVVVDPANELSERP